MHTAKATSFLAAQSVHFMASLSLEGGYSLREATRVNSKNTEAGRPTMPDSARKRGTAVSQLAAFCFNLAMIVSCAIDVGGALPSSARNAVQMSFFEVARTRAEPLLKPPPRFELIESPAAAPVP